MAPFFLAWSFGPRPRGRRGEGLFVATALLLVTGLAFGGWLGREAALAVVGAFFPFLVWTALRFGVHGASLTVLGVSALSVWGTAQGHGPFVAGSFDHRMILLWGFLGVVMLTTMALAAVTEERRRARGALRESEARFRGLVEDANDIIYALSTDGVFSYVSPDWTRFLGHEASEVECQPFEAFVHPDEVEKCREVIRSIAESGPERGDIEYRFKHQDGDWRWYSTDISASKSEGGGGANAHRNRTRYHRGQEGAVGFGTGEPGLTSNTSAARAVRRKWPPLECWSPVSLTRSTRRLVPSTA